MIAIGDLVIIEPTLFSLGNKGPFGLRTEPTVIMNDTLSGVAYPNEIMIVVGLEETSPVRWGKDITFVDVKVLHPKGFIGWILEHNLVVVN
jgi:hypothetical protein